MTGYQSPLPKSIRELVRHQRTGHPGLHLDKFAESWSEQGVSGGKPSELVQKPTLDQVVQASVRPPAEFDFAQTVARRELVWRQAGARMLRAKTTSALTLHLSRASALENASICLHPLYGFVYLPGTGVKGLARAYAETVWLPSQLGKDWQAADSTQWDAALDQIDAVFGYAPYVKLHKNTLEISSAFVAALNAQRIRRHDARKKFANEQPDEVTICQDKPTQCMTSAAGQVVFHDAWPATWPELQTDLLNNHHAAYYGEGKPPGDWENPIPVYFLSAKPGVEFQFAISPRRRNESSAELTLAENWLRGGLQHLGAGAKTNSGYGCFAWEATQADPVPSQSPLLPWKTPLELVTPAFLAGANQQAADCDLRPATLRGHLRWWWRTLYAGALKPELLRMIEAAIWGDTTASGAVRIIVEPLNAVHPMLFDRQSIINRNNLPQPPDRKTTQGLAYYSYGMNDSGRQRYFLAPPSSWTLRIIARPISESRCPGVPECPRTAEDVLAHAQRALWLLCSLGGIGAKSRKGFGSLLALNNELSRYASDDRIVAASREWITAPLIETSVSNYWLILDSVAAAVQSFAKKHKHRAEKQALGLPRRIGPPVSGRFQGGEHVNRTNRHTSPLQIHLARASSGHFVVKFTAFPSSQLPDIETSRQFLRTAVDEISAQMASLAKTAGKNSTVWNPLELPTRVNEPVRQLPKPGERVQVTLLTERTKKGGWQARHALSNLSGPIQNSELVPASSNAGDTSEVIVAFCNGREIAFRWPTAADIARSQKPPQTPKHRRR